MTLLYIIIALAAIYLAYTFGIKKGNAQAVQVVDAGKNSSSHEQAHNHSQMTHRNHGGGCC